MQVKKNQFSDYLISQFVTDKSASRPNARSSIAQIHVAIGQSALLRRTCLLFGPKRTSVSAPHMSAFGGKADMTVCVCLLLRSLLGVKRTWVGALHMSAFDPKRTWAT